MMDDATKNILKSAVGAIILTIVLTIDVILAACL